jgi:cytoskeleton protein RodZ
LAEEPELSVGQHLRREREQKNISLESIAKVTRITLQNLEALERDNFHALPAPVFVRGFLRTYAAYLGLDPKKIIEIYQAQMNASAVSQEVEKGPPPRSIQSLAKYMIILFIIALAVGIASYFLLEKTPIPPPPSPPSSPKISLPQTPPAKLPAPEPRSAEEKESSKELEARKQEINLEKASATEEGEKKNERRYVLKVKATEKTWLRIEADNEHVAEALLQPQETATWTARHQFEIIVGNAGGTEIFLNGVSQGRLGESGQVVHLLLPKEIKKTSDEESKER